METKLLTKEDEMTSFIDDFMIKHTERNSFSKKEIYDFCLDLRSIFSN